MQLGKATLNAAVRPVHGAAFVRREAISEREHDVYVTGPLCEALFQDPEAFVDEWVHGSLDHLLLCDVGALLESLLCYYLVGLFDHLGIQAELSACLGIIQKHAPPRLLAKSTLV